MGYLRCLRKWRKRGMPRHSGKFINFFIPNPSDALVLYDCFLYDPHIIFSKTCIFRLFRVGVYKKIYKKKEKGSI
jgi:hypothetical protein